MDAQPPQRAFRALSTAGPSNCENMASAIFTTNHQRHKSVGAPILKDAGIATQKIPTKRTAFGDVSNVLRPLADPALYNFKFHTTTDKPVSVPSTAKPVPSFTAGKENAVQVSSAGFLAPAQRPKNSIPAVTSSTVPTEQAHNALFPVQDASSSVAPTLEAEESQAVKPHAGAARKPMVVFNSEVEYDRVPAVRHSDIASFVNDHAELDADSWSKLKKSPRHAKSQPCLKNADYFQQQQQKPLLRRTQSRYLPVERQIVKDVIVFADEKPNVVPPTGMFSSTGETADVTDTLDAIDTLDVKEAGSYRDAPYVDAVEDFQSENIIPSLLDDTDTSIGQLREEIEAAVIGLDEPEQAQQEAVHYLPAVEERAVNYLSDIPAAVAASTVSEAEEPWDDDADFYDDQAYTTAHSFRSLGDNTTGALTTILMPKMTAKIQNELDIAKAIVESSISAEDLDDEAWDISMVAEYGDEIYGYMKDLEAKMLPNPHYMDMQTEIQWSMRSVLMEWLIQVHARFNLLPETLFLTVNYIDRFLSSKIVSVAKLQLVGATAIFIAAKYEEIICPSIQEIVYMVDGGYTTDEILKAERFMLSMLGFELGWPGPMSFLRRISKADDYDLDTRTLAKYFLEVTIMDERFVACPPSFLAAGAHCLARLMLYKGDWTTAHTHYSGYTWSQVRPLANTILHCCRDAKAHHAAVHEKYASNKFKKASIYVEDEVRRGFMMPNQQSQRHSRHRLSFADSLADNVVGADVPLRSSRLDLLIDTES